MPTASLDEMLELWSTSLREAKQRIRPLFAAPSVAASASGFLDGLLGAERRKTGWMRAEAAGDPGPWRQQAVLGRSHWEADALRDVVREHAVETLADPDAVLVIDETGFLKQGKASAGQGILWRASPVHGLSRQDHQLPDRRVCGLRLGQGPRLYRPSPLPAQGLDGRLCPPSGRARAAGPHLCRRTSPLPPSRSWRLR
jgi:DDE superfamily endonuclease